MKTTNWNNMNTKDFTDYDEMMQFMDKLRAEKKWFIHAMQKGEAQEFCLTWTEHKKYVSHTGDEHYDEVWRTEQGEYKFIQDLDAEHARNIIRMMLRQGRKEQEEAEAAMERLVKMMTGESDDLDLPADDVYHLPGSQTLQ